jgi:hypothetical protein
VEGSYARAARVRAAKLQGLGVELQAARDRSASDGAIVA